MRSSANNASLSSSQDRARRRRNQTITLVLIGIIVLFLICHIGEVAISIYELADLLDGERTAFPVWANTVVIVNHLLIVMNSSLNFVIYCKDVVFRWEIWKDFSYFPCCCDVFCKKLGDYLSKQYCVTIMFCWSVVLVVLMMALASFRLANICMRNEKTTLFISYSKRTYLVWHLTSSNHDMNVDFW